MTLFLISFLAGVLTVLAPCILPLLPIVVGRSSDGQSKYRPLIISTSLAVSIILFTLLLKVSTVFIEIPQSTWAYISGGIIILFGINALFPTLWEHLPFVNRLSRSSNRLLGKNSQRKGIIGDILVGFSLGPIFSSCSPTYFLILATVLPQSVTTGLIYLIAYSLGLSLMLLLIGYIGQRLTSRLQGVSNPHGWFKRGLGVLFIVVGIFIVTGIDKQIEQYILENGYVDVTQIEEQLLDHIEK